MHLHLHQPHFKCGGWWLVATWTQQVSTMKSSTAWNVTCALTHLKSRYSKVFFLVSEEDICSTDKQAFMSRWTKMEPDLDHTPSVGLFSMESLHSSQQVLQTDPSAQRSIHAFSPDPRNSECIYRKPFIFLAQLWSHFPETVCKRRTAKEAASLEDKWKGVKEERVSNSHILLRCRKRTENGWWWWCSAVTPAIPTLVGLTHASCRLRRIYPGPNSPGKRGHMNLILRNGNGTKQVLGGGKCNNEGSQGNICRI